MEVDANGMSISAFDCLILSVYLVAGIVAGIVYFGCLAWNVRLFAEGGSVTTTIVLMAGRIAVLGGLLVLASRQGALPLLMMALGVFIARFAIIRRVMAVQP
jgi:F1F0 ATPase subunit 2